MHHTCWTSRCPEVGGREASHSDSSKRAANPSESFSARQSLGVPEAGTSRTSLGCQGASCTPSVSVPPVTVELVALGLARRQLPWHRQLRFQTNLQTLRPFLLIFLSPLGPELARREETQRWKKRTGHQRSCPRRSCEPGVDLEGRAWQVHVKERDRSAQENEAWGRCGRPPSQVKVTKFLVRDLNSRCHRMAEKGRGREHVCRQ